MVIPRAFSSGALNPRLVSQEKSSRCFYIRCHAYCLDEKMCCRVWWGVMWWHQNKTKRRISDPAEYDESSWKSTGFHPSERYKNFKLKKTHLSMSSNFMALIDLFASASVCCGTRNKYQWTQAFPFLSKGGEGKLTVIAAVRVVLPWSTWPIVPIFKWGCHHKKYRVMSVGVRDT